MGKSVYITIDFNRPVHGYPVIQLTDPSAEGGVIVDFGYTEKAFDQYTGDAYVDSSG